jgi:hypothetical protein
MMLRVCPVHRLTTPGTRCLMCGECAHEERYKQCDVCRRVVRNRCDACYECPKCGRVGRVPGLCNAHGTFGGSLAIAARTRAALVLQCMLKPEAGFIRANRTSDDLWPLLRIVVDYL